MRSALQDQVAQGGGGRTDRSWLAANVFDGPVGIAPVARRHVLGYGGVPMVAAGAQMSGDPLALQKDLDGTRRQPHLDLAAGKAIGDAIEMALELDMVVDADPAHAPFGEGVGLAGQWLEMGPIELLQQGAAGYTHRAERPVLI